MKYFPGIASIPNKWTEVTDSSYLFETVVGSSSMTNSDETFTAIVAPMGQTDVPVEKDNQVIDKMYYNEQFNNFTIRDGVDFKESLNVTCSTDGSQAVTYDIVKGASNLDVPEWVSFDNDTNSLVGQAPGYDSDKNNTYVFYVSAQVSGGATVLTPIKTEVESFDFEVLAAMILTYAAFGIAIS